MSRSIDIESILPIVLAELKSLPSDPRINKLTAAVTKKVGVPDIKTVGELIHELSSHSHRSAKTRSKSPKSRSRTVKSRSRTVFHNTAVPIMVGGAMNPNTKLRLLFAAILLLFVLSVFGRARPELLALRNVITAVAGGVVILPNLINYAEQLFTERRLFVAELVENGEDVVVRLDFKRTDKTLIHEDHAGSVRYSTVIGPMDPTFGELPRLPGSILFALLHRQNVRLLPNGNLDIPHVAFRIMRARIAGMHRLPDYREERDYYHEAQVAAGMGAPEGAALGPFVPPEPIETIQVLRGSEANGSNPRNMITFQDLADGDVIISFRYGNGGRIYNKETHTGDILLLSTYNNPQVSKTQYINQPIDLASRRAYRVQLVDRITEGSHVGGRRRSRKSKTRRFRRTIRR